MWRHEAPGLGLDGWRGPHIKIYACECLVDVFGQSDITIVSKDISEREAWLALSQVDELKPMLAGALKVVGQEELK